MNGDDHEPTKSALHLEDHQPQKHLSQPSSLNIEDINSHSNNGVQQFNRRTQLIIVITICIVSIVLIVTLVLLLLPSKKLPYDNRIFSALLNLAICFT